MTNQPGEIAATARRTMPAATVIDVERAPRHDGVISAVIEDGDEPATFVAACGRCSFLTTSPADPVTAQRRLSEHLATAHLIRRQSIGLLAVDRAALL